MDLARFARKAWKPVVEEGDGAVTASKYSGIPWLAPGEAWPGCKNCGKPMQLFLQLDLDAIPRELRGQHGQGLIQLFYCTSSKPNCEDACESYFGNTKAMCVRLVRPGPQCGSPKSSPVAEAFDAAQILRWEALPDEVPTHVELGELGVDTSGLPDELPGMAAPGDKIGGWPHWIQGVEYGTCGVCGKPVPPGKAARFDPARGGVVCRSDGGGPLTLSGRALAGLLALAEGRDVELAERDAQAAADALGALTEWHLGRPLKGAAFLRQVTDPPVSTRRG